MTGNIKTPDGKHVTLPDGTKREIMDDGYFDAGELVSEFLSLEINPFPRSNAAEFEMETLDHLKGKYGQEIEQAEDLHAQNSKRFVDYEKKSD